jgi:hypothetical protein
VNYVAEIPTNDEVINVPPFAMNKIARDAMQEIINKYIKRSIVKPLDFAANAPDFLVRKQHGPEGTLASKRWHGVEDYRYLNMTKKDEVFSPPSVQELINIEGISNKFYCSIDLIQGYHHIHLKASTAIRQPSSLEDLQAGCNITYFHMDYSTVVKFSQEPSKRSCVDLKIKVVL